MRSKLMLLCLAALVLLPLASRAQSLLGGYITGSLDLRVNVFDRDAEIGADNTPQYDNQLTGVEGWLNLVYATKSFDAGIRFDLFNNSDLRDPVGSYTDQGIGRWYLRKEIDQLEISGGYLYDQIGTGIIFRAYEERALLIDNALFGLRLTYALSDNWQIKAFGGKQKFLFDTYDAIIKGGSIEGFISEGEGAKMLTLAPGIGMVNRTLGDHAVASLVDEITFYTPADRDEVQPKYNTYAFSLYNTLTAGSISWFAEAAYKTEETLFDPDEERALGTGGTVLGQLVNQSGTVFYTNISYAKSGWGISLEGKRTEYFTFRTNPLLVENDGQINFLPPMMRQNTYRLTARYAPATQELGELAFQADVRYRLNRSWSFNVNFSNITDLEDELLYREIYSAVHYKKKRQWELIGGLQMQSYNQDVYEGKPGVPMVETVTPYAEFLYRFTPKKSIRVEAQYMSTEEDYGSWAFLLAELGLAPNWIFTVSDMYNIDPKKTDKLHYPTVGMVYTKGPNRFSLSYVKQVEGVVCSGGICRLEPAFSGFRFTASSTF